VSAPGQRQVLALPAALLCVGLMTPVAGVAQAPIDGPLRPWLAAARSPLSTQPPSLPPAAQLQQLANGEPHWVARWGAASPSVSWTEAALDLVVKYRQNPLRAARVLVYVNAAMHDALLECEVKGCAATAQRVAMHAAGGVVLEHLYPEETAGRWQAVAARATAATVAVTGDSRELARAWRIGLDAAESAIQRALFDGADDIWNIQNRPAPGPAVWRASPPLLQHNPVEAAAPGWRTWVLRSGSEIAWPTPPAPGSDAYRAELEEVLQVHRTLTEEQKRIADEWNLDLGTVTPAGVWNKRAIALTREHKLPLRETARMLVALNVAIFDAFVSCWHAKLRFWTPRPITAIRDSIDPQFTPHLVTPGFPAFPSGHATISGAASEVLAAFFPSAATGLRLAANEAAMSRLYGGIHARSDNTLGLQVGRLIGARVAASLR